MTTKRISIITILFWEILLMCAHAKDNQTLYEVRFTFTPPQPATTVTLTGDYWKWDPRAVPMLRDSDGTYSVTVSLPKGVYLYKFVLDDGKKWFHDPQNPNSIPDGFGGHNSVCTVGGAKFEPAKLVAATLPQRGNPVEIPVKNVPKNLNRSWIPVRFENGELVYDKGPREKGRGQLLLSKQLFWYPPDVRPTSATIAPRPLFVYLPPDYAKSKQRYPVVYLHDGQNVWDDESCCFGHGGWFLNRLMDENTSIPRAILVGIPNSSARRTEYGLGDNIVALQPSPYLRYLVEVVKPAIDKNFRTKPGREYTSLMGSSMGGMISIYGGYAYPEVFGNVAALSTSFWIPDARGQSLLDVVKTHGRGKFRLYVDSGTAGDQQDGAPLTREFAELARKSGWKDGVDFMHFEDVGAFHNERAWRQRAWRPLMFVLAPDAWTEPKK